MLSNKPIEVISGNTIVEAKPQGVSKGSLVELICKRDPVVTGELPPSMPGSSSGVEGSVGNSGAVEMDMPPGSGAAAVAAHSLGLGAPAGGQQWQAAGGSSGGVPPLPQQQQRQQQAGHPPLPHGQTSPGAGGGVRGLASGAVDFVLAVGDDRSDEDMFTAIEQYADTPRHPAEVSE